MFLERKDLPSHMSSHYSPTEIVRDVDYPSTGCLLLNDGKQFLQDMEPHTLQISCWFGVPDSSVLDDLYPISTVIQS